MDFLSVFKKWKWHWNISFSHFKAFIQVFVFFTHFFYSSLSRFSGWFAQLWNVYVHSVYRSRTTKIIFSLSLSFFAYHSCYFIFLFSLLFSLSFLTNSFLLCCLYISVIIFLLFFFLFKSLVFFLSFSFSLSPLVWSVVNTVLPPMNSGIATARI